MGTMNEFFLPGVGRVEGRSPTLEEYRLAVAFLRGRFDRIVAVMGLASQHTFQVLTKRASRLSEYLNDYAFKDNVLAAAQKIADGRSISIQKRVNAMREALERDGFLPNVWWGVSAENQKAADERIPSLLNCPAAVRWVSYEPALGPIDFTRIEPEWTNTNALSKETRFKDGRRLDWIVVGGESDQAPQAAHSFDIEWAIQTQKACAEHGVAFFFKQLGSSPRWNEQTWWISDRMGKVEDDWPQPLKGAQAYPGAVDAAA